MRLTPFDDYAVRRTKKNVRLLERDVFFESMVVSDLFNNFYYCETDAGIEQCVAQMPERLWPQIASSAAEIGSRRHPGERFDFAPPCTNDAELEELDKQVRWVIDIVVRYLENPTGVVDYEVDRPSKAQMQSMRLSKFEVVAGEKCQRPACNADRIRYGVLCRLHHYETIFGEPPLT